MSLKQQIDGVLLVDKEPGMTSHDVVAMARRKLQIRKIGHCGTLDPMATGLLILVIGRGTKIQDLLMSEDKTYEGVIRLGIATDTQDREGRVIEEREVPVLDRAAVEAVFAGFCGDFYQTPPMVSAIKKDGVPLYKLARQGKMVEREPRLVHVYQYDLLSVDPPDLAFRVVCSKGFYVRTYAHDIGEKLGCGGHLHALRRTRSGNFDLSRAVSIRQLRESPVAEVEERVLSLAEVSRMRGA
jgi:tRNA pseudouridine55 synthase